MRTISNPEKLYGTRQFGFSHATTSKGPLLHMSGQVAWDADARTVGDDLATQARQVFANLRMVLEADGASAGDVVRLRTYVVDLAPDKLEAVAAACHEFYGDAEPASNTLIGVQSLAMPDLLIEIEATAVLA